MSTATKIPWQATPATTRHASQCSCQRTQTLLTNTECQKQEHCNFHLQRPVRDNQFTHSQDERGCHSPQVSMETCQAAETHCICPNVHQASCSPALGSKMVVKRVPIGAHCTSLNVLLCCFQVILIPCLECKRGAPASINRWDKQQAPTTMNETIRRALHTYCRPRKRSFKHCQKHFALQEKARNKKCSLPRDAQSILKISPKSAMLQPPPLFLHTDPNIASLLIVSLHRQRSVRQLRKTPRHIKQILTPKHTIPLILGARLHQKQTSTTLS
ncbi:hypothetical protein COCSUDRAFT_33422 [Coccomyxa subellipsoidea C-169]|uniref:Uncharacterized protein n=1 Tax=Coccomyxa subellipsoidea (strain C-169) TaxID=574566 RepID=I0YWY1_COCSC|nr:hypothetical protein COCSUDRAFT_33422 [Coccomyxa subellipsoidea C-169]EIE22900.1 hypothetical protein COCSUDRAFT_33422 [Coccomyxa subellipsoidea C-169]|eukprot:XP_005647444.1 hypothetical protein COCSUDRAFT_33422 [Coccomyxa subellipsoidea C-169]